MKKSDLENMNKLGTVTISPSKFIGKTINITTKKQYYDEVIEKTHQVTIKELHFMPLKSGWYEENFKSEKKLWFDVSVVIGEDGQCFVLPSYMIENELASLTPEAYNFTPNLTVVE